MDRIRSNIVQGDQQRTSSNGTQPPFSNISVDCRVNGSVLYRTEQQGNNDRMLAGIRRPSEAENVSKHLMVIEHMHP
jgi:hypothetical protein